jgi:hypothetical protein
VRVNALENQLKNQFQHTMGAKKVVRPSFWQTANRAAATVLIVLFVGLLGTGGTVAASASAMPDDTLYTIKRAWENFITALSNLIGRADSIWLHLASVRLEELQYLLAKGNLHPDQLADFNYALETAQIVADDESAPQVMSLITQAKSILQPTRDLIASPEYQKTVQLLGATRNADGNFVWVLPTGTPNAMPTITPILPTATNTALPTITATLVVASNTPLPTATLRASATPRFAPTATRTPAPVIIASATPAPPLPTLTATPSATLTPLPIPLLTQQAVNNPTATPLVVSRATATPTNNNNVESPFVRETIQAVQMTQTAQVAVTEEP